MTDKIEGYDPTIDPDDRCIDGGGHEYYEYDNFTRYKIHYGIWKCLKCDNISVAWEKQK